MDETPEQEPEAVVDPVVAIQEIVGSLDPSSMALSVVTVVEWLEEDGSRSMSVLHTPMAPWAYHGLMTYARDHHLATSHAVAEVAEYLGEYGDFDED